jgi:PAS domain S-box-containing protein
LESITDAFFALDNEWRFTYLNSEAERVLSRSRKELLGKNVWDEFPETMGSTFYREYHRAIAQRITVEFEEYYPPLQTWFEVKGYPSEIGLLVYFRDVNERKRAEKEIREYEERLRAVLVQYASDAITILEADGTIRYQSPAAERAMGYRPEERIGTKIFDYGHPDEVEQARSRFGKLTEYPGSYGPVEIRFRHADGSWRYFEGIGNNLLDDPSVRGIVVNSRDVTERKRA